MNLNPGGKVPHIHDGWFTHDGMQVLQPIVFPPNYPTFPNQPKGMKVVLQERGLWHPRILLTCRVPKCNSTSTSCCATQILEHQPDFLDQKSLVQETIEAVGHLCIFLLKIHCELYFIEYFRGAVKCYLCVHCNYTFTGLQENYPRHLHL